MAMSKDDFKNAFREVVSEEYSNIPDEEEIDFEFSDDFNKKMQKQFFTTKKSIWKSMNSTAKKVAIVALVMLLSSTSVYAVTATIVKIKNEYQLAAEQDIPLEEVDTEDDFAYTKFNDIEKETINDDTTNEVIAERFEDPKTDIYNKMLNSIDFFNEVEFVVETSMVSNNISTIRCQTNIDRGSAYQSVTENGVVITETYCNPQDKYLMYVDNREKTYGYKLGIYRRSDTPYIPLSERILTNETDNIPCYTYRRNVTNCTLASYSLVPQEITYSYLADFELWDIVNENTVYLNRDCIEIKGKTKPYFAEKHNSDTFTMLVDKETGILMKFEGLKNNQISQYITVTECYFGKTNTEIKEFDLNNYDGYTERNLHYIPNEERNK